MPEPQANLVSPRRAVSKELVVIGSGYAGLFTAWQTSMRGVKTSVIAQGWGTPYWSAGGIDVMGYQPPDYSKKIDSPGGFLENFTRENPGHPYSLAGLVNLEQAILAFKELCEKSGYPYHGSLDRNILLPTAMGTLRPACLVPEIMAAGDASQKSPMLIVGFNKYLDFQPMFISDNLNAQGMYARDITLDLESIQKRKFVTSLVLARLFDEPEFRQEVIDLLKSKIGSTARIGFPAVLGLNRSREVIKDLESSLGVPVFEISGLSPSISGIRLQNMLVHAIELNGGTVFTGMEVNEFSRDGKKILTVSTKTSTHQLAHPSEAFVLATGGILGGGILITYDGYAQERIFNLPVPVPYQHMPWFNDKALATEGHPIFRSGIVVDPSFHPVDENLTTSSDNLFVVGAALGNCDPIRERSLSGIALATSHAVAEILSRNRSS